MTETVQSTSDERTVNNVMRHQYRVLSDTEKAQMQAIKDKGLELHELIASVAKSRVALLCDAVRLARENERLARAPLETGAVDPTKWAMPPEPKTWMPAWLREFHCQCETRGRVRLQCVACQAADLIERAPSNGDGDVCSK